MTNENTQPSAMREGACPYCERTVLVYEEPPRCPLCACPLDEQAMRAGYQSVSPPRMMRQGRTKVFYLTEPEGAITEFIQTVPVNDAASFQIGRHDALFFGFPRAGGAVGMSFTSIRAIRDRGCAT